MRVETAMRQLSLDQVKQEREEGERRRQAAVLEVEERCRRERIAAVEEARADEREKAQVAVVELER